MPPCFRTLGQPLIADCDVEHHFLEYGIGHAFCCIARFFGAIEPVRGAADVSGPSIEAHMNQHIEQTPLTRPMGSTPAIPAQHGINVSSYG